MTGEESTGENSARFHPDAKYQDEEWLREQVVEECRSATDIAEECGVTGSTIRRVVRKHGFKPKYKDGAWLDEAFNEEGLTVEEIAEECNASRGTIENWLGRKGIEWRTYGT